jgi:hypothetical protein
MAKMAKMMKTDYPFTYAMSKLSKLLSKMAKMAKMAKTRFVPDAKNDEIQRS